jgi:O-antigen ligase
MRSLAGLYFAVKILLFLSDVIATMLKFSIYNPFFIGGIIITITALLIALCRPYKKTYMNALDTTLLQHFGLLCNLVSAENGFRPKNRAVAFEVMAVLPLFCCVLFFTGKLLKLQKIWGSFKKAYGVLCQQCCNRNNPGDALIDYHNPPLIQQPLIVPTVIENSYGSIDYTA